MTNSTYLASKPRYEILDGLRGVAAMIVVVYHLFEDFGAGVAVQGANHGYLAVDFFFVLSGFVIGYAYDDRWDRMSYGDFFKRRLIRLHPMVIFGSFLGLLMFYFTDGGPFGLVAGTPWYNVLLVFLVACTMIPLGKGMDIRGWQETYPLNGPCWSLMLEYIANILYAFVIRRLGKIALSALVVFFGLLTINHGLNIDIYNAVPDDWYAKNTFIGGWGIEGVQLHIAVTRLLYPFFCGLLISRVGKFIKVKGGFWWAALLVAVLLLMPRVGGNVEENFWMNGVYETLCILVGFPIAVMIGAGSQV
ncbi:MAG: acyltransferase, partial [Bacteroidaceae bacterium]|nr:acyltransferase [Bacteroidaceae bacterium]